MDEKIISRVRQNKNNQRRVTIPKKDKTINDGDLVEIKKIKLK